MLKIPDLPNKDKFESTYTYCQNEWSSPSRIKAFEILQKEDIKIIWDIGANIGVWIEIVQQLFPQAQIHAIEPDPTNYKILESNFSNNSNIILHNTGVYYGIHEGVSMNVSGDPNIGGYMFSALSSNHLGPYTENVVHNSIIFHMQDLEEIFTIPADLVKIDIEGSEYNVIENSSLLKKCRFLLLEFHNHDLEYIYNFILQHLPMYSVEVPLTNEAYGTDHHWFVFLKK